MNIKNEYRLIHDALHGHHSSFLLGRKEYHIETDSDGRKYVDYDNIRFIRQEPKTELFGRKSHFREKITWCVPHDSRVKAFVIDMAALIQPVNNAMIGIDISKLKTQAHGKSAKPTTPKAKGGRRKLGGK